MKEQIANLKLKYENFKKGNENPYIVRTEALLVLEEAKKKGYDQVIDEVEEMLMDIQFSINENKCNCNRSSCG